MPQQALIAAVLPPPPNWRQLPLLPPTLARAGHVGANGTKETLLTGDTAEKVKAAALAAVPGATIQRVETDAEGSPYEAHMTKSDGTHVTVKVDSSFKATATESGFGSGMGPGQPPTNTN